MTDVVAGLITERLKTVSQNQLARDIGSVSPNTIRRWSTGESVPPPERWPALETALELDPGTLERAWLTGTDQPFVLCPREP